MGYDVLCKRSRDMDMTVKTLLKLDDVAGDSTEGWFESLSGLVLEATIFTVVLHTQPGTATLHDAMKSKRIFKRANFKVVKELEDPKDPTKKKSWIWVAVFEYPDVQVLSHATKGMGVNRPLEIFSFKYGAKKA